MLLSLPFRGLMPVVLLVRGYTFFFYEADVANEPAHVHVTKDGHEEKSKHVNG